MLSTAAFEAQTGMKAKKLSATKRFRELKRVAAIYKTCYEQELTHVVIPDQPNFDQESPPSKSCAIFSRRILTQTRARGVDYLARRCRMR